MRKLRNGEVKSFAQVSKGEAVAREEPAFWEGLKWPLQAGGVGGLFPVGGGGEEQTFLSALPPTCPEERLAEYAPLHTKGHPTVH